MPATSQLSREEYLGQNLLAICHLVETKIGHELNLINHRVSWLAASQTFLVIALVTLLPSFDPHNKDSAVRWFLFAIPTIGLALCIQVFLGVRAALTVLREYLLPERGNLIVELNRLAGTSFSGLGPDQLTDFDGAIPAKGIPITLIIMWLSFLCLLVWRTVFL